ncbi:MAG: UTP--glucose-1-phosphate uridylyltransferase GalU [Candidatus Thermoplasmatota archaeon]|nr:UTP--glucose-1-phosphate uridylyltransferase GalU [Candidatus Thermoplasmatota archaeon]
MKAVIPAAGLGTRFLPATKSTPKEMLPVVDKPAIQYVVEEAVKSGIDDILIITGRGKQSIEDYFDISYELESTLRERNDRKKLEEIEKISDMADIHYVRQKKPLGLGHAIFRAKKHVDGDDFAVMLGDDIIFSEKPCIGQLIEQFNSHKSAVIAVGEVPMELVGRYGIADCRAIDNRLYEIVDMVEKPSREEAPSNLAVMGRYVFTSEIFDCIEKTEIGKGGEIQLTDAIKILNGRKKVYAYKFEGKRFDLGNKLDWIKTNIEAALIREEFREELIKFMREKVKEKNR